jgi:hypothetical protein
MRTISGAVRTAVCGTALMLMALPGISAAAEHGGTGGMQQGASGGHDMTKMEDKVFSGKVGPWKGAARLVDMKAHVAASGMKAGGAMPNTHHMAFELTDAKTQKAVTEGTGKVSVTGPDKKTATSDFTVMQGHFGADVNLPAPGKYTFKAQIESAGKKGSATFSYTLK